MNLALAGGLFGGLYVISLRNYPLFHLLSEGSSIVVGVAVFLLVWNGRRLIQGSALVLLGIAFLFVSCIDVLHALAYKGMGLFEGWDEANLATQLWIAGRWLQSVSLFAFTCLIGRYRLKATLVLWAYAGITGLILWSIFGARIFPDSYLEGTGLTHFKIWSEYLISAVLGGSIVVLYRRRDHLDGHVARILAFATGTAIVSELAFTNYVSVYGPANMIGHLLKTLSFFLVYLALIQANLKRPVETLFRELSQAKTIAENSRRWLERVSESTPDVIFVLDVIHNRNVYSNRSISKTLGYSPAEFAKLPHILEQAIHADDLPRAVQFFRDMGGASPGEARQLTHRALHKDGSPRWLEIEVTPFAWDDAGRLKEVIGIARDISGRKQAELRLLDENREIQLANRILRVFIEASGEELYSRALDIVLEGLGSEHGVFGYIDERGDLMCPSLSRLLAECEVSGKCIHYPPEKWKGLWARALREKQILINNEAPRVPAGHVPIRNNLAAPIIFQDRVIGLLNIANKRTDYTQSDAALLKGIAQRIAPDLYAWIQREQRENERRRSQEALGRSERRFRLLSETAARLLSADDPQSCINELCRDVMAFLDCDVFVNFLADESSGRLHLNACAGIPDAVRKEIELLEYGVAVCGCVARERQRIIANHILNSDDARVLLVKSLGVRAYGCHPLMAQRRLLGTLSFGTSTRDCFSEEEVELMRILADQVAVAMQRLQNRNALRASEAALRSVNESLEVKVQERTARLTAANCQLDARARQLRALAGELTTAEQRERKRLAKVLHDGLQQQLAAAKLQVGMITAHANPQAAVKVVEQLLGEAIDMSRSLSAELSPPILQEGGLAAGLEWLCRTMQQRHGFTIDLEVDVRPDFPDDTKTLVFESVRELLFNSVKHSGAPGAKVVLRQEGETVRIAVSDQGQGFDASRSAGVSGGLGLFSIGERLTLIGGWLEIESTPGQGSRFTVIAPHVPSTRSDQSAAADPDGGRIRVMIVDDHQLFREGLVRLCNQAGEIDVVGQAENGKDAIALARELAPDVILMDVNMPEIDGIEATRVITSFTPETQVVGLSMHAEPQIETDMRNAGAADYLNKGCGNAELLTAIRRSRADLTDRPAEAAGARR